MEENYNAKYDASFDRTIRGFSTVIDEALADSARLRSALDRISEGAELSAEQVRKLLDQYPELISAVRQTDTGFTLAAEDIIRKNDEICGTVRDLIESRRELAQTQLAELENAGAEKAVLDERREDLERYDALLALLTVDITKVSEDAGTLSDKLREASDTIKLIGKAASEQAENGAVTAGTYSALIESGSELSGCLETVNGGLSLNIGALKELEAQEYRNIISENRLKAAKLGREAASKAMSGEDISAVTAQIKELETENLLYESVIAGILSAGEKSPGKSSAGGNSDTAKAGFESFMAEHEAMHDRGLLSDREYYEKLSEANEKYYKDCEQHLGDYQKNVTRIYNGGKAIYKNETDALAAQLGQRLSAGEMTGSEYAEELNKLAGQRYGKGSVYYGTEFAEEQFAALSSEANESGLKAQKSEAAARLEYIASQYSKGLTDVYAYRAQLSQLMNDISGMGFAQLEENISKKLSDMSGIYDSRLSSLRSAGLSPEEFVRQWTLLNEKLYKGSEPAVYRRNLSDISEYELSQLESSLAKKNITPGQYKAGLAELRQKYGTDLAAKDTYEYELELLRANNDLSEKAQQDFITEWKKLNEDTYKDSDTASYLANARKIAEYERKLLEESFGKGLISAKDYLRSLGEILDEAQLGRNIRAQWTTDALDRITDSEEKQIKEQKKAALDSLNAQAQALREIKDESERAAQAEKLRLELIRAQQELERASGQKNILVYENGVFRYDQDAEKIAALSGKVSSARQSAESAQIEAQISELKKEQDSISALYDEMLANHTGRELTEKLLVESLGGRWNGQGLAAASGAAALIGAAKNAAPALLAEKPVSVGTITVNNDFHIDSIEGMVSGKIDEMCGRMSGKLKERLPEALK